MTGGRNEQRLQLVAQLVLDQRLFALKSAVDQLQRSRDQLAAINAAAAPSDLPALTAELVDVAYQRWADIRRGELNTIIARQTAICSDARADAGKAFGRARALEGALARLKSRR